MPTRPDQKREIEGHLTISRVSSNIEESYILITIEDKANYNRLIEVKVEMADLAHALTGLGNTECEIQGLADQEAINYLGAKRIIKRVSCDKVSSDKGLQKKYVIDHFDKNYKSKGWGLLYDGTDSQQNEPLHQYSIYTYKRYGSE